MEKPAVRVKPFAPNGLLSEKQQEQLLSWYFQGTHRTITQTEIAKELGVSRMTVYNKINKNVDAPFDDFSLGMINALIRIYNADLELSKVKSENMKKAIKKADKAQEMANKLSKKIGE